MPGTSQGAVRSGRKTAIPVDVTSSLYIAAFLLDVDPETEQITTIRLVGNPDKLARLPTG